VRKSYQETGSESSAECWFQCHRQPSHRHCCPTDSLLTRPQHPIHVLHSLQHQQSEKQISFSLCKVYSFIGFMLGMFICIEWQVTVSRWCSDITLQWFSIKMYAHSSTIIMKTCFQICITFWWMYKWWAIYECNGGLAYKLARKQEDRCF